MTDQPISQTAILFSRYIKQESDWKDATRIPKDDLRQFYTEQYKPNYKIDNPGSNIVNFAGLFRELKKQKLVQVNTVDGITVVKIRMPKPTVAQNIANSAVHHSPNKFNGSPPGMSPGTTAASRKGTSKIKRKRRARAVDQYITMRDGDPVEVIYDQNSGRSGDPSLQNGIAIVAKGYDCSICKVHMNSKLNLDQHLKGNKHRVQTLLQALKDKRLRFQCHSYVEVKSEYDHEGGSIRLDDIKPSTKKTITITIKNTSPDKILILTQYELIKRNRVFSFDDSQKVCNRGKAVKIEPGETYEVYMTVSPRNVNHYHACVAFVFQNDQEGKTIHIVRYLSAICTYPQVKEQFGATSPFKHPPRVTLSRPRGKIEEGFPPERDQQEELEKIQELKSYQVVDWMRKLVNMGLKNSSNLSGVEVDQLQKIRTVLQFDLTLTSHKSLFDLLLRLEEIQMEVDIRKYDMEEATMDYAAHNRRLLTLKVPGLAENRPSVLKGDHLFVKLKEGNEDVEYKGYVHAVECEKVHLGFGHKLMDKFIGGMKFNVRFTFNRLPLKLMHRAVELAEEHSLNDLLFPTPAVVGTRGTIQPVNTKLRFYDRKLEDNEQQKTAINHIVSGTSRPAPYVLFGPPGTGKTVTMVESIKQVIRCIPKSCVLACAPSNSAADLLCQRIITHLSKEEVFRMNAMSRQNDTIPEDIKACCNIRGGRAYFPKKEILEKYKVIITTLITAGRIASANFPAGHFSHVFIDECGHATEPEALIALAGILESDICKPDGGQVVFAGDPEQLGPVLRSPVAIKHGLGQSMLERLMKTCDVYSRTDGKNPPYDPCLITKLVRNYRSHPAILEQPNKMFYFDELQVFADKMERESLCQWNELPKKGFPIIFHGVVGKDQREERSPSFFNPEECWTVMEYVDKLLNARGTMRLKPKQIGIISPYRRQVQKLATALRKKNLPDLKVGSVEEFQGQERMVIIISTVRSSEEFLPIDTNFKLGFLRNPKRFNVAVTRAKALLIVVGNPYLLRVDQHWNQLLQYVIQKGGYTGCDMDVEKEEELDIIERLAAVKLDTVDEPFVSGVTEQEEPEWRGEK